VVEASHPDPRCRTHACVENAGVTVDCIAQEIAAAGLLDGGRIEARALSGGVSSDIWLLDDGRRRLVVKQALAQLRVASEWKADVGRNAVEQRYLRFVDRIMPGAAPVVRYVSQAHRFFAMDYLGDDFQTWKARLFAGEVQPGVGESVGAVMGRIHAETWGRDDVRAMFDTTAWFDQLRLDPYLRTLAPLYPVLSSLIHAEIERITRHRICLIHGDFSPKNLLVARDRVVLIDCEAAWFGDPTFDVAFLLNHLLLKALRMSDHRASILAVARSTWRGYAAQLGENRAAVVMAGLPRLLLLLMLARIDGKSPVEYLTADADKQVVRRFTTRRLQNVPGDLESLLSAWTAELSAA